MTSDQVFDLVYEAVRKALSGVAERHQLAEVAAEAAARRWDLLLAAESAK